MKHNQNGLTVIEVMVAVGVCSLTTLFAVVGYQYTIANAQALESIQMMEANRLLLAKSIQKGVCSESADPISGKYGKLSITGTPVKSKGESCPTGCVLTYTFDDTAHVGLRGKVVEVNVLNNLNLAMSNATTLAEKYLPKRFAQAEVVTGDNCAAMALTDPEFTEGAVTGTEEGDVDPGTPSPPEGSGGGTTTEPEETPDPEVTTPSGSITPDVTPSGVVCDDSYVPPAGHTIVMLDSKSYNITEDSYYVKNGVNLLNEFTKAHGRAPNSGEKIQFITTCATAIVGKTAGKAAGGAAVTVGNFDPSVSLSMVNFGAIVGLGGQGSILTMCKKISKCYLTFSGAGMVKGEQGGTAIEGSTTTPLIIQNYGIIAGGGGGGALGRGGVGMGAGGGGAPYGAAGKGYWEYNPAQPGIFNVGGRGAHSGDGRYAGRGGGWGDYGAEGASSGSYWRGLPGVVKTGSVTITNLNSGFTKGS